MVDRQSTNGTKESANTPDISSRDIIAMASVLARKLNWAVRSTWNDRVDTPLPRKLLDGVVDRHCADIIAEITSNLPNALHKTTPDC